MKMLVAAALAVTLFGGLHAFKSGGANSDAIAGEMDQPGNTYRLVANGDEAACNVMRGAAVSAGLFSLTAGQDCRSLMPGMEQAKYWREQDDGSVAISQNGIDPIVTFSVADGDGYESYAPAMPLLSMALAE